MKSRKSAGLICALVLLSAWIVIANMNRTIRVYGASIIVPNQYPMIQAAIDNANDGDMVIVKSGTYYEHVVIDKAVALVGENKETTIIDGSWTGTVVNITRSGASVSGFTIQHSGTHVGLVDPPYGDAGIFMIDVNNCSLSQNTMVEDAAGIQLEQGADSNTITNNTIANDIVGISIAYAGFNNLVGNKVANNSIFGVDLGWAADSNIVSDNYVNASACALASINVDDSYYNVLFGNYVSNSSAGIWIARSASNRIYHNVFVNNVQNVNSSLFGEPSLFNFWDDGYPSGGNYWSDHVGTDKKCGPSQDQLGSDGVEDTVYQIDANNTDRYPLIRPWLLGPRNLAITTTVGGTTSPAPGNYVYNTTTCADVFAIANSNYGFDHWELDGENTTETSPTSVRTDADHVLKAVFTLTKHALTITSTSGGNTNLTAGTYIFETNTEISVMAEPDPGYYLDSWELDNTYMGIANPASVFMNEDHTLEASFRPLDVGHNVATKWISARNVVFQGFNLSIQVTVMNIGSDTESFNVTAYLNSTSMMPQNVTLDSGACKIVAFTLNTSSFSKGNYTMWSYSWPVPGETDTSDNNFTGGCIFVSIMGDLTGSTPGVPDGKVDIRDIALVAKSFGSTVRGWNVNCDVTGPIPGVPDGKIDIRDIALVAKHFGESSP